MWALDGKGEDLVKPYRQHTAVELLAHCPSTGYSRCLDVMVSSYREFGTNPIGSGVSMLLFLVGTLLFLAETLLCLAETRCYGASRF